MRTGITVSVINHKGGVLKTATTVNLGAALARMGKRVLLIDLDAQQNLTQSLIGQVEPGAGVPTLFEALCEERGLDEVIRPTHIKGLDIVPCEEDFAGADLSLVSAVGREGILKSCLARTSTAKSYDFILCDNPPSISLVVVNSLVASDYYLVPCSSEYLPMVGLSLLAKSVGKLEKVAPQLQVLGVVLTLFAKNERICNQVEALLRKDIGENLFRTRIRVNTRAKSAPAVRRTIFEHEDNANGRGTEDFTALGAEFMQRMEELEAAISAEHAANG